MLTVAMWVHVILNCLVCYDARPPSERSQLLAELRLFPVVVATLAVWCAVAWSIG